MDWIAETRKCLPVVVQFDEWHMQLDWGDCVRTYRARIGQRGRVTIPAEVRERLGLKPDDDVEFIVDDDRIILRRAAFTVKSVYRSVKPLSQPMDFNEMVRIAKDDRAERLMHKTKTEW